MLLFSGALAGCAFDATGGSDGVASDSEAIVGGTSMSSAEAARAGLVGLVATTSTLDRTGYCSGTLLAPRLVLTAAHCRATRRGPVRHAVFGADIFGAERALVPIERIVRHPSADLAVVLLASDAPLGWSYATVPSPLRTSLSGARVSVMGFGRRSASDGQSGGPAQRMEARAVALEPGMPIVTVVSPSRSGLCFGDSGGPAFAAVEGALAQVGVLSNGNPSCDGGDTYVSVPMFSSWILETADDLGQALEDDAREQEREQG